MSKKRAGVAFIVLLTSALAGQALAQGPEIEFKSNADDLTKIRSVVEEFRQDIIHKDGYALTKLVLNPAVSCILCGWMTTLPAVRARTHAPGTSFRDCSNGCPEMVVVQQGWFTMGGAGG